MRRVGRQNGGTFTLINVIRRAWMEAAQEKKKKETSTQSTKGRKNLKIVTSHAWLSTRTDEVIDPTNCPKKTKP